MLMEQELTERTEFDVSSVARRSLHVWNFQFAFFNLQFAMLQVRGRLPFGRWRVAVYGMSVNAYS